MENNCLTMKCLDKKPRLVNKQKMGKCNNKGKVSFSSLKKRGWGLDPRLHSSTAIKYVFFLFSALLRCCMMRKVACFLVKKHTQKRRTARTHCDQKVIIVQNNLAKKHICILQLRAIYVQNHWTVCKIVRIFSDQKLHFASVCKWGKNPYMPH